MGCLLGNQGTNVTCHLLHSPAHLWTRPAAKRLPCTLGGRVPYKSILSIRERLANLPRMLSGPSLVAIGMATVAMETASSMATQHPLSVQAMGDFLGHTHP